MKVKAVVLMGALLVTAATPAEARQGGQPGCSVEQGQLLIEQGKYKSAVREFTCVVDAQPTAVEGYRGRIEALLLLGRYSDAMRDYGLVTALVEPVDPHAASAILAHYAARLDIDPYDVRALTGASFARWWLFQYGIAIQLTNQLVAIEPNDLYGHLFRGSSRVLLGANAAAGMADLEVAITLAPGSPDVRWVVADAYLYGRADYDRAFSEAMLALQKGLDTPRVHAILGAAYNAFGMETEAAAHIKQHIALVTSDLVAASPLPPGASATLNLVPWRTYEIPIPAMAGQTISLSVRSTNVSDSIAVLLTPDGHPVVGSDDARVYHAVVRWAAQESVTYRLRVTSFEAISTGQLVVTRK